MPAMIRKNDKWLKLAKKILKSGPPKNEQGQQVKEVQSSKEKIY